MPTSRHIQTSLSAGEFDPLLWSREDVSFFYNSARIIENAVPLPQGGAKRREGWRYRALQRGPISEISLGGATVTGPNGGTTGNLTDGDETTLFQTGSSNASFFDPVGGHDNGPTAEFLGWLVIVLFVAAGGLLSLVGVIVDSYRLWPVASFMPNLGAVLEEFAVRQGDTLFLWIVKLASPVILVLLLVELGIGLIGRVAPQLNVFVFSQPVKSLLATFMMLLFLTFVYESLSEFLRPSNGVLEFLRLAL